MRRPISQEDAAHASARAPRPRTRQDRRTEQSVVGQWPTDLRTRDSRVRSVVRFRAQPCLQSHSGAPIDGMSPRVLWDVVRAAAARAGIDKLAPHDLRRTCARLCHLAGGELDQIQFLLGHVSIQTTEHYLGCKQKLRTVRPVWSYRGEHATKHGTLRDPRSPCDESPAGPSFRRRRPPPRWPPRVAVRIGQPRPRSFWFTALGQAVGHGSVWLRFSGPKGTTCLRQH